MAEQPTVGRVVHFYSKAVAGEDGRGLNGQGEGPYAAIVTQAYPGPYANLKVLPPFAPPFDEGSVNHIDDAGLDPVRWWVWPPRS